METGYNNQTLIKIFRKGLLLFLADKIMVRPEGYPTTINRWYQAAIKYNNQFKMAEAAREKWRAKRGKRELIKLKVTHQEKAVIRRVLSESDRKDYMAQGKCFKCAQMGHISRDCPMKGQNSRTENKKLSAREMFVKTRAMVLKQREAEQNEILDLMGTESF
ncbi:hypothetical protein WG66_012477 [Moniliophthora roreri]|nr:hypothetical protein WG66_012477 [Moniliophthora roreri]